jgi:adenine-specific DNA-methyltransferase
MTDTIKYFKKNNELSFVQDKNAQTHKLIIGDNYDALLNLLIEYRGKIDVIYIDPPYGKDSMGEFAQTNYNNAITRDNLLSMLYPRLVLARQLLSDNGVIFCSIDDKNQAYVKGLFDEVFEESNFLANFMWNKTATPPSLGKDIRKKYEYVLCYQNGKRDEGLSAGIIVGGDMPLLNSGNPIRTIKFNKDSVIFKINGEFKDGYKKKTQLLTNINIANGKADKDFELRGNFKCTQETVDKEVKNGTVFYIKSNEFSIRYEREGERKKKPSNIINKEECGVGTNEDGGKELISIIENNIFDNPKPISLIKYLIGLVNRNLIILDFFAGSGTTGQAVLELNKEDGGKRQFILATANEITDTTPNGIVNDVTSKRLKRVMTGECYDGSKDFKWNEKNKPLDGNLDVYDIATVAPYSDEPFEKIDETLYGQEKLGVKEKIKWVCENFENTQKTLEDE